MKLLAFSDLHCDLDAARSLVERSADVDVVAGAGDFASVHSGLEQTIGALAGLDGKAVFVPGNNETEDALRDATAETTGIIPALVLHGEEGSFGYGPDPDDLEAGITFFGLGAGIPTTPWDWSFDLSEEEAAERLENCPDQLDLLVLHSPPYGHCDVSGAGKHLGSRAILEAIEQKQPRVAVCGHIHESWGAESRIGETVVINLGPDGRVIEL